MIYENPKIQLILMESDEIIRTSGGEDEWLQDDPALGKGDGIIQYPTN